MTEEKRERKAANKTVRVLCQIAQMICENNGAGSEKEIITLLNAAKIVTSWMELDDDFWDLILEKREIIIQELVEDHKEEILDKLY